MSPKSNKRVPKFFRTIVIQKYLLQKRDPSATISFSSVFWREKKWIQLLILQDLLLHNYLENGTVTQCSESIRGMLKILLNSPLKASFLIDWSSKGSSRSFWLLCRYIAKKFVKEIRSYRCARLIKFASGRRIEEWWK